MRKGKDCPQMSQMRAGYPQITKITQINKEYIYNNKKWIFLKSKLSGHFVITKFNLCNLRNLWISRPYLRHLRTTLASPARQQG